MAKKKVEDDDKKPMTPVEDPELAPFLRQAVEENQKAFGRGNVFMGEDAHKLNVGVPWPALSLAWLSDVNVLPFKMIGVAGPSGSNKSSMAFEFDRILNGFGMLNETEGGKFSEPLIRSIIGDKKFEKRFAPHINKDLNQAQANFTRIIQGYEDAAENAKTLEISKKTISHLILDSLAGADTAGTSAKIEKEGSVQATVATMAKAWMGYFRWMTSAIVGFPITVTVVNHLLDVVGSQYNAKYTPGGKGQRYFSALSYYVSRRNTPKPPRKTFVVEGKTYKGERNVRTLVIHLEKSSFGTEGRKMEVDMIWYHGQDGKQVTYFDWDTASAEILAEHQSMLWHGDSKTKLKDLIDVTPSDATLSPTYDSKRLGLKDAQGSEIGKALMQDPKLVEEVYDFLHINKHQVWSGRMPSFTDGKKRSTPPPTLKEALEAGEEISRNLKEEEEAADKTKTVVSMPAAPVPIEQETYDLNNADVEVEPQ